MNISLEYHEYLGWDRILNSTTKNLALGSSGGPGHFKLFRSNCFTGPLILLICQMGFGVISCGFLANSQARLQAPHSFGSLPRIMWMKSADKIRGELFGLEFSK